MFWKRKDSGGKLVSTNVFILIPIFSTMNPLNSPIGRRMGTSQTVVRMSKDHPISVVEATRWLKITTPDDLKIAEQPLIPYIDLSHLCLPLYLF